MTPEKVMCPVCMEEFSSLTIESHVDKCLFLNESSQESAGTSSETYSPSTRITKSIKRKSTVLEISNNKIEEEIENNTQVTKRKCTNKNIPLAERMRPTTLSSYIGQSHILGPEAMLFQLLEKSKIPNIVLWGPPGCGKTSLANVISHMCKKHAAIRYVKLSAAIAGINEVKEIINVAANELKFGRRTIVFMDEIHRFNKTQQDVFLPHIESGTITLIGATTENPSFSLNSALLSRCRVIVLEKLQVEDLISILKRAVSSLEGTIHIPLADCTNSISDSNVIPKFIIDEPTIKWLAETCDGDARIALGGLELAVQSKITDDEDFLIGPVAITLEDIQDSLKKSHMLYDKKGDQHYDTISALHKSVRASDENASLYWLTRMICSGEDPVYIARRLVRMASEDIGLEDPKALGIAVHTMHACKMLGMPECDVILAQCVTYLAKAPKSRLMEDSLRAAQRLVENYKGSQPAVPLHLRNAPMKLMRNLGYGKGYNMSQKEDSGLNYLPEGLENINFFEG